MAGYSASIKICKENGGVAGMKNNSQRFKHHLIRPLQMHVGGQFIIKR